MISSHDNNFINKKGLIDALKKFHQCLKNKAKITQKEWTNAFHQADNVVHFVTMKRQQLQKCRLQRTLSFIADLVKNPV